jgi:hypothetical protein
MNLRPITLQKPAADNGLDLDQLNHHQVAWRQPSTGRCYILQTLSFPVFQSAGQGWVIDGGQVNGRCAHDRCPNRQCPQSNVPRDVNGGHVLSSDVPATMLLYSFHSIVYISDNGQRDPILATLSKVDDVHAAERFLRAE